MADKLIQSINYNNETVNIYQNNSIVPSKAYSKFLKVMADDIDNDVVPFGEPWFKGSCGVIYATVNNSVIGYIAYTNSGTDVAYIVSLFVDSEYECRDVYKTLLIEFENVATEMQCASISVTIPINNLSALEAAQDIKLVNLYNQLYKKIE